MCVHACNNFLVCMYLMLCVCIHAKTLCAYMRAIILCARVVCMCVNDLCACVCAKNLCACVVCMCVNDFRAYMCEKFAYMHVYNNFVCMRGVYVFNDLCEYVCVQKCRAHGCVQ